MEHHHAVASEVPTGQESSGDQLLKKFREPEPRRRPWAGRYHDSRKDTFSCTWPRNVKNWQRSQKGGEDGAYILFVPRPETSEQGRTGGRYRPEYVQVSREAGPQEQLQKVLDDAEGKEWHLVGVAGGLPDNGMILFWDTQRPSFGRTSG